MWKFIYTTGWKLCFGGRREISFANFVEGGFNRPEIKVTGGSSKCPKGWKRRGANFWIGKSVYCLLGFDHNRNWPISPHLILERQDSDPKHRNILVKTIVGKLCAEILRYLGRAMDQRSTLWLICFQPILNVETIQFWTSWLQTTFRMAQVWKGVRQSKRKGRKNLGYASKPHHRVLC